MRGGRETVVRVGHSRNDGGGTAGAYRSVINGEDYSKCNCK